MFKNLWKRCSFRFLFTVFHLSSLVMWARLMLHIIHVRFIVVGPKGEPWLHGDHETTAFFCVAALWNDNQAVTHPSQPASQPSFTWWHTENHSDAAGTRDWRLCVCVCVFVSECVVTDHVCMCVCPNAHESLSSTLWSYCKDEYIYYKASLGGGPLSGVTLELTHFLSHTLSLGRDVLHKCPAAHTSHDCLPQMMDHMC